MLLSCFSGTADASAQGLPGQTSREDAHGDHVTVCPAGFQKLTHGGSRPGQLLRGPRKAPLPSEAAPVPLTSRGDASSLTGGLCPSQAGVLCHRPRSRSPGSPCPRVTSWLHGAGPRGPPAEPLWVGISGQVQNLGSSDSAPGQIPSLWSLASSGDEPDLPTGRKDGQYAPYPSPPSSIPRHGLLSSRPLGSSRLLCTRCPGGGSSATAALLPPPPGVCPACDAGMVAESTAPVLPQRDDGEDPSPTPGSQPSCRLLQAHHSGCFLDILSLPLSQSASESRVHPLLSISAATTLAKLPSFFARTPA